VAVLGCGRRADRGRPPRVPLPKADATDVVALRLAFHGDNGVVFTATNHLVQDTPAILKASATWSSRPARHEPLAQKIVTAEGRIRHE